MPIRVVNLKQNKLRGVSGQAYILEQSKLLCCERFGVQVLGCSAQDVAEAPTLQSGKKAKGRHIDKAKLKSSNQVLKKPCGPVDGYSDGNSASDASWDQLSSEIHASFVLFQSSNSIVTGEDEEKE